MMQAARRWIPLVVLLALGGLRPSFAADVTVSVTGFRNEKGMALIYLWKAPDGFPRETEKAFQQKTVKIEGTDASAVFKDVEPGVYAASVTHDENGNGKMDTGFMGKPKEGYGASNNPKNKLSAPSFEQCKFSVDQGGKTVDIQLRY